MSDSIERLQSTKRSWRHMHDRCKNPKNAKYHRYGGRGITVCSRWDDFNTFLADMGMKPELGLTIDRKDNEGIYEPQNCRWASVSEQGKNTSRVIPITYRGKTQSLNAWAKEIGIKRLTLRRRLYVEKLSIEQAFTRPVTRSGKDVLVTHAGKTQNLKEWSDELGISYFALRKRIHEGCQIKDIIKTIPKDKVETDG